MNWRADGAPLAVFDCINAAVWQATVAGNAEGGGAFVVRYAARWAALMEAHMECGATLEACAWDASMDANTEGISGFAVGAAVAMLAKTWRHGEALRVWHNLKAQIGSEGDTANANGGVLSPAMFES